MTFPVFFLHLQQQVKRPRSSRSCVRMDAVCRARLKQLRGPRSQVPKGLKAPHACPECSTSYKSCDALIMHRLRHIEGKHWPCLVSTDSYHTMHQSHDPEHQNPAGFIPAQKP